MVLLSRSVIIGFTMGAPIYYYNATSGHHWNPIPIAKVGITRHPCPVLCLHGHPAMHLCLLMLQAAGPRLHITTRDLATTTALLTAAGCALVLLQAILLAPDT